MTPAATLPRLESANVGGGQKRPADSDAENSRPALRRLRVFEDVPDDLASDDQYDPPALFELPSWPIIYTKGEVNQMAFFAMDVGHKVVLRSKGPIDFSFEHCDCGYCVRGCFACQGNSALPKADANGDLQTPAVPAAAATQGEE